MLGAFTCLLGFQLAGEIIARGLGLPVPGPVIGLALLAGGLWVRAVRHRSAASDLDETPLGKVAAALLANLGLLFVPAGVGIVEQLPAVSGSGTAITLALVGSTLLTLLVTVAVFRLTKRVLP